MTKYEITNKRDGLKFVIKYESFPSVRQPEWGTPAFIKVKNQCDEWELANGSDAGLSEEGVPLWSVADSMEVVETNIDAEIAAEEEKKKEHKKWLQDLKNLKPSDVTDLASLTDAFFVLKNAFLRSVSAD